MKTKKCPDCNGTGKDGHDRCVPPNWYVCDRCNGTGKIKKETTNKITDKELKKKIKRIEEILKEMTHKEKVKMYRKCSKKELIEMIIQANIHLDWYIDKYREEENKNS